MVSPRKRIALVGNAPPRADQGAAIDAADRVVRFNNCPGLGGLRGERVDDLVLINCGGQMREWLGDPGFTQRPAVTRAERIVLPIHPHKDALLGAEPEPDPDPDGVNYAEEAEERLKRSGKPVELIPARIFEAAAEATGQRLTPDMPPPSSGFLTLLWLLQEEPASHFDMYGFSFEGWQGHAWDRERRFVRRLAEDGRVSVH